MPAEQMNRVERQEATNKTLSPEEAKAIDLIKNQPSKVLEWLIKKTFNVAEGEKNIETKSNLKFLYESIIDQIYISYKTDKNQTLGWDDKTTLNSAFFFMKFLNPDKYANETWSFQRTFVSGEKKNLFYAAVEKEMEDIFAHPSDIYQNKNTETKTIGQEEYQKNKDDYDRQWRKEVPNSIKTIEWAPEKILVSGEDILFPKQYFYKWKSNVDIEKGIKDIIPDMQTKIEALKKDPSIDPKSIELQVASSVSNIRYADNKDLLWKRAHYVGETVKKWWISDVSIVINNPEYSWYGDEWWPKYPPTVDDLNEKFVAWSEAMQALNKIWSVSMEEVAKSIQDEWSNSKYFDVLEQYMYREYQYAKVSLVYKKREEVPTGKQVLQIKKAPPALTLNDGLIQRKTGQIIAKNPYYEKTETWSHEYKKVNGVTFPISEEYMALQISDNALTQPTQRYGISSAEYANKSKHVLSNTQYKEWQHGKWATTSEELHIDLDSKWVDEFSTNLIKNDKIGGRELTSKETNTFIWQYINKM